MKKIGVGFASVTELEKKYVNEALDDSRLSPSIFVRRFEKEFATKHDKKHGIMNNSGTSAIHIAWKLCEKQKDGMTKPKSLYLRLHLFQPRMPLYTRA